MAFEAIVECDATSVERAIELVAQTSAAKSGRHIEWVRRRLREAVRFTAENKPEHPDYSAHHALSLPVFQTAAANGGLIDDGSVN